MRDLETIKAENNRAIDAFHIAKRARTDARGFSCPCGEFFSSKVFGWELLAQRHLWEHPTCENRLVQEGYCLSGCNQIRTAGEAS